MRAPPSLLRASSENTRPAHALGPQNAVHPDTLELNLVLRGRELVRVERAHVQQTSNHYGLIAPGSLHSSWTEREGATYRNVHLDVAQLGELASELKLRAPRWDVGPFRASPELRRLLAKLCPKRDTHDLLGLMLTDTLALQLALVLLDTHRPTHEQPRLPRATPTKKLRHAAELLRDDLTSRPTLASLAATAEMSPYHFLRSFKRAYGKPPHAYAMALRLERATELIQSTDAPLTDIAFEVGFGASSRLTEAFKRLHGVTPSMWRSRQRGEQFSEGTRAQSPRSRKQRRK